MNDEIITLRHISKQFGNKCVLEDINLVINRGDYLSVVGLSGAGKSTLMNIIGTLDMKFDGDYFYYDKKIMESNAGKFRNNNVGFIFQQYNLIPELNAYDNAILPYIYSGAVNKKVEQNVSYWFEYFGLKGKENQISNTMSGGEKQRVALIRSIALDPEIIIADEPTGNLDKNNSDLIRDFLVQMNKKGKTIIVVTHDLEFAKDATRKLKLEAGKLYEE
jgi:putative ABC transport system ATP-binding protein